MNTLSKITKTLRDALRKVRPTSGRRRRLFVRSGEISVDRRIDSLEERCLLAGTLGGPPDVVITKGVVASSNPAAALDAAAGPAGVTFSEPGTNDQPFSGVISSDLIRTGATPQPLNANLTNAHPGDIVRLAILLENRATNGTAFDVTFQDVLPAGVTYIADSLQIVDGTGEELSYRDLAAATDGSGLFAAGILLDDSGTTVGSFSQPDHCGSLDALTVDEPGRNIAIAFYDVTVQNLPGSTPNFNSDATLTAFAQTEGGGNLSLSPVDNASIALERIDLELTKQVSNASPLSGDAVTWTIDVTNNLANATSAATGVVIRDLVPSGQAVVAASAVVPAGGTFDEITGTWTVGNSIAPGNTVQLTFRTVAANSVEFTTALVDVELNGTVLTSPIEEGGSVTYSVTLTNRAEAATVDATGVVVSNLLPTGLTFVSDTRTSGSFSPSTGVWDLSGVTLVPGQSETITISATAAVGTAGTSIPISAEVTALNETDIDSTSNNASIIEDDDYTQVIIVKAAATTRTVSGKAFLDVNNDGVNGGETGVTGITVNAYAPDGTLSGTATTNAAGDYSITGVTSEAVRLEFVGRSLSQSTTTAQSPPASSSTVSSLAFLNAGTTAVTANLALYQPTAQAQFVTTCFVYSGQSTLDPATEPAVLAFNEDGTVKTTLATIAQVGATNGLAVHQFSGDQFVAAFQKRHSAIGPDGNSAIYRISSTGVVSTFIRLDDFFGVDSAGAPAHNPTDWFTDAPAFDAVGKVALGDVDISEDGRFLYTINLATRELIQIPIGSGGTNTPVDYVLGDTRSVQAFPILGDTLVAPTNGGIALGDLGLDPATNIRPFALTVRDGLVYVGMVNSAETSASPLDLAAFVYVFDPVTGQFRDTAASAFPLGTRVNGGGWQEWTSDFATLPTFYDPVGDFFVIGNAQPWLTDIEFDNNGDMILGFRDRIGDQVGHMVGDPTGADSDGSGSPDQYYHDTRGEILRLRKATADTWTVEAGHTAGDGTEYYAGDEALFDPLATPLHPEVAQGALVQVPGFNDIITTAIDPQSFFAGGVITLDNATGVQTSALDLYTGSDVSDITTFGKNNGLGDLEYTNNLSMEIGNRVWHDTDQDGIQDAGELALANVDLALFDVSSPLLPLLVAATTTNSAGEYYFNDSNVIYADGGDPVGLRALTNYEVRVATAEFQAGGTLEEFRVTQRDRSPVLVATTLQPVSGAAAFDSDLNGTLDTARSQRVDILTATGLAADGVKVLITNTTGGFARVESDGTVFFEFADGVVSGNFEYTIVDDRIDSDAAGFDDDADGVTDRAVVSFTTGATGTTDHSLDLGFVQAKVDLKLAKLSSRKFAVEGDTVTFFVTLTNDFLTADTAATGVTVTDVLPAGLTFLPTSVVTSQGTFNGTTWTLPDAIAPGESATLSYQATVNVGTAGSILVNAAQVASQNETDIDSLINNDDGDRSEDDEDDAIVLVGTLTSSTVVNTAQVSAANEPDFDSTPQNDDHNQSEDDENSISFTLSTATNVFDFGDLPDTYLTLAASGGPSHRRGTSTFLGVSIDDEIDGQPSATAVADGPDEDGVRFLTPLIPGTSASIQVVANTDGFLNAWIDFDADGTLDELTITTIDSVDLGAPVAASDLALTAGTHTLAIAVPATATGLMAARFRYTNDQMAALRSPGGAWPNGEVEDYMLRQIGDRVWFDHDADGVPDPVTEAGLSGITVVLSADLDGNGVLENYPTTTDANGFYRFDGVPQGTYTVTVTPPASLAATFDLDGGTDNVSAVALTSTTTFRQDVDFGYRGIGLIGDTVWFDVNANGIQDTGETGIPGVAVQLTGDLNGDAVTDVTLNTTTNASGVYEFQNLVAGNYSVTVTPAAGLVPTFDADSVATPNTSQTSLSIGTVNRSQDFGYRGSGVIGDTVWIDSDGDGIRDTGEPGIAGVAVQLTGDTNGDSLIDVTLNAATDAFGVYQFINLQPGVYTTTVTPPVGSVQTFDADGLATANQSTATLAAGATLLSEDFGYRGTGVIGDSVWLDANGDGVRDSGEVGISGVTVQLSGDVNSDSVPDLAFTTTTSATGAYEFLNLLPGAYTVTVSQPVGTTPTVDADGLSTTNSSFLTLAAGDTNRSQDFGYRTTTATSGTALIGDVVWDDVDGDGVIGTGEPGHAGVGVQLTGDTNGDSIVDVTLNTVTNGVGLYEFTNLDAGTYTVTVTPPSGSVQTFDADGVSTADTSVVVLAAGELNRAQDFGYRTLATTGLIGDFIWFDSDRDGVQDVGEPGIAGVAVQLTGDLDGDSVIDVTLNTVTSGAGLYEFPNLTPGSYTITVTPPAGSTPTFDADGTATPHSSIINLASGAVIRTHDFGYAGTATIGDLIFSDVDASNSFTTGDTGIAGADVTLQFDVNGDGVADYTTTSTTDSNGLYSFTNLLPGTYVVTVDLAALAGTVSPVVDPDGTNDGTTSVTVVAGATNLSQDFGYPSASPLTVDLAIIKDNNNPQDLAAIGSIVSYTISVSNLGAADATNAVVTDTLPSQFIGATWTAVGTAGTVFNTSGTGDLSETVSIPTAGSITYTVSAQLNATFSGTVTNTATVTTPQTDSDLTNNSATDVSSVTPLTLTAETPLIPGEPFQLGARGMSHVALVPFVVGTQPGTGVVNGVTVGIADPEVFMIGFVCVDDRIIAVYDVPENFAGQTLYFQSYEATPTPRLSNVIEAVVGAPRFVATQTGTNAAVTEGAGSDSFSLVLSQAPASNVIVDVHSQSPTRLSVSSTTVVFTPDNWNIPQTVTLQAVDDNVFRGDDVVSVRLSVQPGSDAAFLNSFAETIEVQVTDNDVLTTPMITTGTTTTQNQRPTISWSAVSGAESYDIWISSTLDVPNPIVQTNVVGTSFTPTSPLGIGRLAVWVRARTATGRVSPYSAAARIDITTPPAMTSIPDGIDRRPEISWAAVEGAARYELWVNNNTTSVSRVIHDTTLTGTSFVPATDLGFGIHAAWVRAVNQYGQVSEWSAAEIFGVGVELLSPTGSTFNTQPTFTWTSVPDAATFEIYIRVGSSVVRQAGLLSPEYVPSAPLPAGNHRWWVRGIAANGKAGNWSAPGEVAIGGRPAILTPSATGTFSTSPEFTWEPVEGAVSYAIYVSLLDVQGSNGANLPRLEFQSDNLTTASYTHATALSSSGATYRVWVRAISGSGALSAWSSAVTFTVAALDDIDNADSGDSLPQLLANAQEIHEGEQLSNRPVAAAHLASSPGGQQSREFTSTQTATVVAHTASSEIYLADHDHDVDLAMAQAAVAGW